MYVRYTYLKEVTALKLAKLLTKPQNKRADQAWERAFGMVEKVEGKPLFLKTHMLRTRDLDASSWF